MLKAQKQSTTLVVLYKTKLSILKSYKPYNIFNKEKIMTIIKIDITKENELTDAEYDAVNNAFMRKAKEMGVFDNYLEEDIHWTIECRIGENNGTR